MLYSCTHLAPLGVKGLSRRRTRDNRAQQSAAMLCSLANRADIILTTLLQIFHGKSPVKKKSENRSILRRFRKMFAAKAAQHSERHRTMSRDVLRCATALPQKLNQVQVLGNLPNGIARQPHGNVPALP